jgi:hypothetical protein
MTRRRRAPEPARRSWRIDPELLVHLVLFAGIALLAMIRSPGAYHDDDLDHYYMAKAALSQPHFLVDAWGRPGFTILYALPAQFGWNAVRLTTIVLSLATLVMTWRAARALDAERPGAWAGLAGWQPLFLLLSFSALTEPLAALLIAVVLYAQAAGRPRLAAVAAGLLPLVRLELGVVALLVVGWVLTTRRNAWRELAWIPLPVVLWGIAGGLIHGDPGWLPGTIFGSSRPLNSSGPVGYFRNLVTVTGGAVFLGLFLGAVAFLLRPAHAGRRAPAFAGLLFLAVFGLLTLLTWEALPFGGSIGFLRHLIVLAPAGGLIAGFGYQAMIAAEGRSRWPFVLTTLAVTALVALVLSHRLAADFYILPGRDWSRLQMLAPVVILVLAAPFAGRWRRHVVSAVALVAALGTVAFLRPIDLNVEQKVIRKAVEDLRSSQLLARPLMVNHPWVYFLTGRDRWDRRATPYVTLANLDAARPGTIVFWENHYGHRLYGDVPRERLENDPRWERLYEVESGDGQFHVVLFERKAD